MTDKRPALGRGLSALIPEAPLAAEPPASTEVDVWRLSPNRHQPRTHLDDDRLEELARSIKASGIIQPIVVRKDGDRYEIVAGERRWRAAQRAGLTRVPIVVRDVADDQLLPMALIENIQRQDLNPIEEAAAYRKLAEEYRLTQEDIATAVGKDRSSVANYLRLLKLPDEVRAELATGRLTMGHARALLGVSDEARQREAAREVIAKGLSVRETESLIKQLTRPRPLRDTAPGAAPDVHTRAAEERLRLALGTRVSIVRKGSGGRIEIAFTSEDELQRLFEHLTHA
jgi:ParB family chromosome partitioning protein